ncbi:probable G-protein coupled receptor 82 [Protopterus annectens]|uniref:probable G-protein coupled receptor 82 n=1 Tax=Protopterus annectens TaxID=7888 RepID=UPI001CFB2781|nr:probable G-protein coupled receptor 82 [Protopterus annectens]
MENYSEGYCAINVMDPPCLQPSAVTTVLLPITYFLLFIVSVLGNSLSLWIFSKGIQLKTATHAYLINLVISNLLLCSAMPFIGLYHKEGNQWKHDSALCITVASIVTPIMHSTMNASIIILCWLAISRYAILKRQKTVMKDLSNFLYDKIFLTVVIKKFCQRKFANYLCIGIWLTVLGPTIPILVYYAFVESKLTSNITEVCYNKKLELGGQTSRISSLVVSIVFFLCLFLVLLYYELIRRQVYKSQKKTSIGERHYIYKKVQRNIAVIQAVLVTCFFPYHLFKMVFILLTKEQLNDYQLNILIETKNVLLCLAALRSGTDPIIYMTLDKTFRRQVYIYFRKQSPRSNSSTIKNTAEINSDVSHQQINKAIAITN